MITYHFIKAISNAIKNTFKFGFWLLLAPFKILLAPIKWLGGK